MREPSAIHEQYPELFQLIGGFFNQDMFDEFPTEEAALADYIAVTSKADRGQALTELTQLRATSHTEADLRSAMSRLSSAYAPRNSSTPIGDFADRIAAALRASLDQPTT